MKLIKKISVFFPAYNEEKNIKEILTKAQKILKNEDNVGIAKI